MKKFNIIIFIGILITLGNLNILVINFRINVNDLSHNKNSPERLPISSGYWYLNHTIEINGDSEWNTTAFTYDWCYGSGTWNDPYVIENVTIDGQNILDRGFDIQNSNVYFRINNCTVQYCTTGIILLLLTNATISNTICKFNHDGIGIIQCSNTTLTGNFCYNNSLGTGIEVSTCDNCTIQGNKCYNNYENIDFHSSNEMLIINNTVVGNVYTFPPGGAVTMKLWKTNNSVISGNLVMDNHDFSGAGIILFYCHNNTLIANYLINNTRGIEIREHSTSNSIIGNIFSNNQEENIIVDPEATPVEIAWNLIDGHLDSIIITDGDGGDVNWSQVASFAWASGSGSFSDPYLIENITFDGWYYGVHIIGLTIENSSSYFIIRNCKFLHLDSGTDGAGIIFKNVENGKLIENECWDIIGDGIRLEFSNNNIIVKNKVQHNKYGMVFNNCMFINISYNNINANNHGIHLYDCVFTVITQNQINNNNGYGIILEEGSHNQVILNILINNKDCILEINSTGNTIGNNTCTNRIVIPGYNLFLIIFPITFTTMIIIILTKKRRI